MDYGNVAYIGQELKIIQLPYIESDGNETWLQAIAVDDDQEEYLVTWKNGIDLDQDDIVCDWEDYEVRKL